MDGKNPKGVFVSGEANGDDISESGWLLILASIRVFCGPLLPGRSLTPLRKRHGGPRPSQLFCDDGMGISGCSSYLAGLFLSLLDSHFRNMLTSAPGPTLALGFPKQSKFLVTSYAGFVFLVPCGTWLFFLLVIWFMGKEGIIIPW